MGLGGGVTTPRVGNKTFLSAGAGITKYNEIQNLRWEKKAPVISNTIQKHIIMISTQNVTSLYDHITILSQSEEE